MSESDPSETDPSPPGFVRKSLRRVRTFGKVLVLVLAAYTFVVIMGLIPVNNEFQPAADGVEIFVTSNPIHAEVIVPVRNQIKDWQTRFPAANFPVDTSTAHYAAIGWGDRGFFLHTPTWEEFTLSTAANALLLPSSTCMHVTMKDAVTESETTRAVRISAEQYENLVTFVESSLRYAPSGDVIPIDMSYGLNDTFYEAVGSYHALNTCNCWAGDALQAAGIRVGWLTPLPKTVFFYLPDNPPKED